MRSVSQCLWMAGLLLTSWMPASPTCCAGDWSGFLGPDRNGISTETGLISQWPDSGLPEVWRTEGGVGMSGIVVSGGLAITMLQTAGDQQVVALDATSGKVQWATSVAKNYKNQMGNGPRATPVVHDSRVLAFTGDGVLCALEAKTGRLLWRSDLIKQHGGRVADYGMASSPLIYGRTVIVTIGCPDATVIACDMASGETVWTAGRNEAAGYSSPVLLNVGDTQQLVVFSGASVSGLDPATGEAQWRYAYVTDYHCNIATPISVNGDVLISAGENHGTTVLRPEAGGPSKVVWESTGTGSRFRNEWQTSILLGGHLYGFDNVGSAGPVTHLTCLDAATGKLAWTQPRFGKGNLIAADGKLFMTTMKGEVVVVKASPEAFEELGRQTVIETTRQAPALSNGLLYVRDDSHIVCLDVRAK